jgi:ubiquinone/menaquinone biosynthesis C-methylase UbiE
MHKPSLTPSEHVTENRRYWDAMADEWVSAGELSWALTDPIWGIWHLPEADLNMLPTDMRGLRAIELGCGTGYVSAWMARRGADVLGIDNSSKQLATAMRLNAEYGTSIRFAHANAERVPVADAQFDFAISEYGAAIWCDPYQWIPEAHRLLRPGGRLTFLGNHPLMQIATPPNGDDCEAVLHQPYFSLHRQDWTDAEIDPGGIEFNLPISKWLQLFRDTGFEVIDYQELQAPPDRHNKAFSVHAEWAQRWPSEQVWQLQKT